MTGDAAFAKTPGVKLLVVLTALSLAACGKANDIPAIKAEAEGMMKNYQARLDDLNRRADSIMQRGNAIGVTNPDAQNASRMFAQAKGKLEQLRGNVGNSAAEMGKLKDKLELSRYFDRMSRELATGTMEINADFDTVEAWITLAEAKPTQVSSRQPAVPPPPAPDSPPAPTPDPVR